MTPKLYEGTKRLLALPMTRGAYNQYRGWETPAGENPADPGYLVEYQDGGKPNCPRHAGYISWSPAEVFERSYKEVPGADLPAHQQRVLAEKTELDDRLTKLRVFFSHPNFPGLPGDEQERLQAQALAMQSYLKVLCERISAF